LGNTGPSLGPPPHFGLVDRPDLWAGRSLPIVFESFTLVGVVDIEASQGDTLVVSRESREVRLAYPLYGSILNLL
jgi:hypothetical protein